MTEPDTAPDAPRVAVIGGGLAGLAAAVGLCPHRIDVELFEARRRLGGRAASFRDSRSGELIDRCGHVAMGCCTNLADLCRRTGIADCFRRQRRLHFIGPAATEHSLAATPLVPAPLHLLPGLMRLGYLGLADKLRIVRTMGRLARQTDRGDPDDQTIGSWLREQGESDRAIRRFWSVVLVSALSETVERASRAAARQVFVDGFLGSRRAYEVLVPQPPLATIYDELAGGWLTRHNVTVHRGTRIKRIDGDARRAAAVVLADGSRRPFDFVVAAVPWRKVRGLFPEAMLRALPSLEPVRHLEPASITAVHLWFDRPLTRLPNAVLVGGLGQWLFGRSRQPVDSDSSELGHYYQIVISASHELAGRDRQDLVGQLRRELAAIWPAARRARLLHWRVATDPAAVFSVRPGVDRYRPTQPTPIENLVLAGDWTSTGWPATMESAVRSGYLAAEALLKTLGHHERLLVPDLPRSLLTRWLAGANRET